MAILCSDSFNASNTGSIHGRTLDNALGGSESKTWIVVGSGWGIDSNRAVASGFAPFALVDLPTANGVRALIRTATTNNRSALIARASASVIGPAVCLYLATSNDALVIRQFNDSDFYGPDVASESVSVSNDTDYILQLVESGNIFTGSLHDAGTGDLIESVSYDFGETVFSNTCWGMTPYTGEGIQADNAIFYTPDAPPEGGGLLLQLMQHGQFNGGLL